MIDDDYTKAVAMLKFFTITFLFCTQVALADCDCGEDPLAKKLAEMQEKGKSQKVECPYQINLPKITKDYVFKMRPGLINLMSSPSMINEIDSGKLNGCIKSGDTVYFGISFYDAEGSAGVGGLGKYDMKTKKTTIIRHKDAVNSTTEVLYEEKGVVHFSTSREGECCTTIQGFISHKF